MRIVMMVLRSDQFQIHSLPQMLHMALVEVFAPPTCALANSKLTEAGITTAVILNC